jgi:hypothetical protein
MDAKSFLRRFWREAERRPAMMQKILYWVMQWAGRVMMVALWTAIAFAQSATPNGVKRIDNPDGGRIFPGAIGGQAAPQLLFRAQRLHRINGQDATNGKQNRNCAH